MTWLWVLVGGMVGAPLRFLVDVAVTRWVRTPFPAGTLAANLLGCLLLGLVAGLVAGADSAAFALLATGVAGALSTYSTFAIETVRLVEERRLLLATANVVASVVLGLGALLVGLAVS